MDPSAALFSSYKLFQLYWFWSPPMDTVGGNTLVWRPGLLVGASSDLHAEDCDDADVGGLTELHRDQTIGLRVPKGARGRSYCRSIVLLNDARYNILELFVELGELLDAGFNNLLGPLVYLVPLVLDLIRTDDHVNGRLRDGLYLLGVELKLVFKFLGHVRQI